MKTTLDIPESLLNELLDSGDFSSKKEAVNTAIEAYLQDRRVAALLAAAGTMDDFMTREELERIRDDGQR
ncbi:MAG: type II toxin-antitoxin system VapB family antitoxin [Opitutales bacterium]|nr:type II toxin-antitoxin system VapB family antitoxin [Opitutales bacterium]